MKRALVVAVALAPLVAWISPAGAAGEIDRLAVYAGTWHLDARHFKTPLSKARVESTTIANTCWRREQYFACNQVVDGASVALLVFTYDAKRTRYTTSFIPPDGGSAQSGVLTISGNRWTYPWQDKDAAGKTVYLRVTNTFSSPSTIAYRQEYSYDRLHWVLTARGAERKLHV